MIAGDLGPHPRQCPARRLRLRRRGHDCGGGATMATIEKATRSGTGKAARSETAFEKYVTVKGLKKPPEGREWKARKDPTGRLVWKAAGDKDEPLVIEVGKRIDGRNVTVTRITVP